MLPVVAIVGRPNVGKSTLFNALTRTRDALVADLPGVTRDRQYGISRVGERPLVLVDTGGLVSGAEGIDYLTAHQVHQAVEESTLVLFVVSARDGLTAADEEVAEVLRQKGVPVLLVANKTDGLDADVAVADFASLGLGEAAQVAAAHRRGVEKLMGRVDEFLPPAEPEEPEEDEPDRRRLAIVGRPNVGKSTLVNRLLGEERVMAFDMPGTTRDTITVQWNKNGLEYDLIDTAGVRRRAKVHDAVEKFSVIKALQAIERAHVVILVLDAREGLTDQDMTLLSHVLEQGRGLVIAVNKWDGLEDDHRKQVLDELDRKLDFVPWARRVRISALHGTGMDILLRAVNDAWESATRELPTSALTRVLIKAFEAHQPPMKQGRTARLRFAHMGGKMPPRIVVHGNRVDTVPVSYRRYLENTFIKAFKLSGTPVIIDFRSGDNPYKDRRNTLTERQVKRRKRLKKFTSRKKGR
ncbi:ribosome biogenesis GTPase Der [Marinihelvus fidelis]|uniref:GTPase Der n=1 Tax=Marinihelvus fidelis TaxID=2613842 RepID=A0A5N0TC80_9GAMM|nr:ribosome biogenesis GTPase Der [Marinihelvus fidelis]KAA9132024.1 ribosome biogenesis GTPase Der [Marinihelvus fidelis]